MATVAQLCAGALAAVILTDYVAPAGSTLSLRTQIGPSATGQASLHAVNRSGKGDRIRPMQSADQHGIATVEVVGIRNAAVVYRDRDGRVLFRTDPVSNATIVVKDVVLPEVTIRDSIRSPVQPVPVQSRDASPQPTAIPDGCDPAFSPLAVKANITGRCVAWRAIPTRVAAVR